MYACEASMFCSQEVWPIQLPTNTLTQSHPLQISNLWQMFSIFWKRRVTFGKKCAFLGLKVCFSSKHSLSLWNQKIEKKKKNFSKFEPILSSFYIWHLQELIMISSSVFFLLPPHNFVMYPRWQSSINWYSQIW
jgi:hypothetical protein